MRIIKQITPGVVVRGMTPAEFYACLDYGTIERDDFDFRIIGCDERAVVRYASPGYNSLLSQNVFKLDDAGYPVLETTEADIVNFLSALDQTPNVLVTVVASGKRSFPLYFVHSDLSWAFFWKRNDEEWVVVAGSQLITPPENSWFQLVKNTLATKERSKVSFRMQWHSVSGEPLYHTVISTNRRKRFVEAMPEAPVLRAGIKEWPNMYMANFDLIDRMEYLLGVN